MSNQFITEEVQKIFNDPIHARKDNAEKAALASAWVCAHFKAYNIKIFDMKETSSLADYYLLCTTENTIQAKSLVEETIVQLKKHQLKTLSLEGINDGEWILLDMGEIIIHFFQETTREIYGLDVLWAECQQLEIPQHYFTGSGSMFEKQHEDFSDEKDYF